METRLAGLASWAEVGRSSSVAADGPTGILVSKEPPGPPGVIKGVDVLRGVEVGLRGGVIEGVQVGSIWIRLVGLGGIGVGGLEVGVKVAVGVAQLVTNMMSARKRYPCLFMAGSPAGSE